MRSIRRFFASAIATTALSAAVPALAADPVPSLDLRGFRAPTDAASGMYLEPAASPDTWEWNVGLWANYVYSPVTLKDSAGDTFKVLSHQLTSDLTANIGIAKRLALGLDMPVLLYQTGDAPTADSTRVLGPTDIPKHGLGDLGINAKLTLVRPTGGEFGGFALAVHERFTLPTGDEASFLGEGAITSETRLLAEYRLVALGVHASAGFKYRASKERFGCEALPIAADGSDPCTNQFGNEIPFGLGISLRPQAFGIDEKGHVTIFLETHGYIPLSPDSPFSSGSGKVAEAQIALSARYQIGDASILAGVEHAMLGGIGNAPLRATLAVGWAPREHDIDHDGIPDDVDQCRELAEDKDGFQDADGCPDGDNDDDGVPDADDKCPTTKEDEDGFQDDDGCPDPDNDQDGILDKDDACPNEAGPKNVDPKKNGCPNKDLDGDGVLGAADKCPDEPEDKDGFQDADGCPDPDNDGDGIADKDDACPNERGAPSEDPKRNGCPNSDPDKDTFLTPSAPPAIAPGEDKCPNEPETWNGYQDEDGCPDEDPANKKAKPLIVVKDKKGAAVVEVARKIDFTSATEVDPKSLPVLRALAAELIAHPEWTAQIGVRPPNKAKGKPEEGASKAKAIVDAVAKLARRPKSAEAVDWEAVKGQPGAEAQGVGFAIKGYTTPPAAAVAAPAKAKDVAAPAPLAKPKK